MKGRKEIKSQGAIDGGSRGQSRDHTHVLSGWTANARSSRFKDEMIVWKTPFWANGERYPAFNVVENEANSETSFC